MQRKLVSAALIVCLAFTPNPINAEPSEPVLVEVACVICGTVIVAGGTWMGYKLYKVAKDKLYPPPRVPTNATPSLHFSATTDRHMGDVASSDGIIYSIDMTQLTPEQKEANTLPDGSQATRYAIATVKGSSDLQTWTASSPIEIWFSGSWYVVRYNGLAASGRNAITNVSTGEMTMRPVTIDTEQPVGNARFLKL